MHVLVEVVDGKEVMRVDNIMADVQSRGKSHAVDCMFRLHRRLLVTCNACFDGSLKQTALLFLKTDKGVRLLDRIVASV